MGNQNKNEWILVKGDDKKEKPGYVRRSVARTKDFEFDVLIAWAPILAIAAASFAKAFGNALGEKLGQSFADALLGKQGMDQFEKEVISRLEKIESKLTEVLDFIYSELPRLVERTMERALMKREAAKLESQRSTVEIALRAFDEATQASNTSKDDEVYLLNATTETYQTGYVLLRHGTEWYLSGVHAFSQIFAACSRLIQHDPKKYTKFLGSFASNYASLFRQLISADNTHSFVAEKRRLDDELNHSGTIVNDQFPGKYLIGGYSDEGRANDNPWFTAYFADYSLDSNQQVVAAFHQQTGYGWKQSPEELANVVGAKIAHWWKPPFSDHAIASLNWWDDQFHRATAIAVEAARIAKEHPARLKEVEAAIDTIKHCLDGCEKLIELR